jgi:hypothetical protein
MFRLFTLRCERISMRKNFHSMLCVEKWEQKKSKRKRRMKWNVRRNWSICVLLWTMWQCAVVMDSEAHGFSLCFIFLKNSCNFSAVEAAGKLWHKLYGGWGRR